MRGTTARDMIAGRALWSVEAVDCRTWLAALPDDVVHACITSPPYYGLRDYGNERQVGLEDSPDEYVAALVGIFADVRRVLHPSGVLWLNLGDSYAGGAGGRGDVGNVIAGTMTRTRPVGAGRIVRGIPADAKPKDLLGVPWRVAFALQADGWYLRQWCPWVKRNPMPESVGDRPANALECVFLLSKRPNYFFDMEAVKQAERPADAGRSAYPFGGPKSEEDPDGLMRTRPRGRRESDGARNLRNADFWFDSVGMLLSGESDDDPGLLGFDVTPTPYKGAHFAVMPRKLIEPMVLSGTSERGVCPACGEPWWRLVEKDRKPTRPGTNTKVNGKGDGDTATAEAKGWNRPQVIGNRDPQRHCTTTKTVGWEPGCDCPAAESVPAVVLDPFGGSGTVPAVAVDRGRRALACDLNPEYVALAVRRLRNITPGTLLT